MKLLTDIGDIEITKHHLKELIFGCRKNFKEGCSGCYFFIDCEEIQTLLGIEIDG